MSLSFESPGYLALLLLVPALWWLGFRSLSALGPARRAIALLLRSAVLLLIVLGLMQTQWVQRSDRLTVLYLLDQSLSIPAEQRQAMAEYVNAEVARHRNQQRRDRAGVIVFAREAVIEHPAFEDDIRTSATSEAALDRQYTNLAAALKLAQAALPADSAGRVVLVTDGNENLGSAVQQAQALAEAGIGIDVVPIRYAARTEVAVEKVTLPPDVTRGQPFDLRIVLHNTAPAEAAGSPQIGGRLRVLRRGADHEQMLVDEDVVLEPGKRVFSVREQIDVPEAYTYEARFVPHDPAQDAMAENNRASAHTYVRGQGRVLLIEDAENRGEFDMLVDRLRRENLQVTVMHTDELFTSLADLQQFDTVLLANVPRELFSDAQIKMLVANTQQMGSGLVMLGGPNSFGAGGWTNTELEAAMPVDFQIKNAKVAPVGALALVIDRSGSMSGQKLAMARAAASAAVDVLSSRDYVTVTTFDSTGYMVVPLTRNEDSRRIKARIDRIGSGGGTNMEPGMVMAYQQLRRAGDAAVRHMVVLTDGQTMGTGYEQLARQMRSERITLSTVAVGGDADLNLLRAMAAAGGGRDYHVTSPRALPRIFQKEARVVSRPVIYERTPGFQPQVKFPHEMIKGIGDELPPITGYVLTSRKQHPLVEVALLSPVPAGEENRTLLASWTYGLGKAVAFTSDAGKRWAGGWTEWPGYDKLFSQMVRWSMRPAGESGKFHVETARNDGNVQVIVTALDKDDEFLNFLNMVGSAVGPDMQARDLRIRQTAPGRYVGEFAAEDAGSYFLMLTPGAGMAPILTGVNVPYSAEFLDRDTNEGLLETLALLRPQGGEAGALIEDRAGAGLDGLLAVDTFRHNLQRATSSQDIWPQLLLAAACLFFADVFIRRVQVGFAWAARALAWLRDRLRGRETPAEVEFIERLRSRKAEVAQSLAAQRADARFELSLDAAQDDDAPELGGVAAATGGVATIAPPRRASTASPPPQAEEDDYTARLLKAKRRAAEDRR